MANSGSDRRKHARVVPADLLPVEVQLIGASFLDIFHA